MGAVLNDLQEHAQGIQYEINRIVSLATQAIEKQESASFERNLYRSELKYLGALIELEESLYKHAEYLRISAGISQSPGGDFPGGFDPSRKANRSDR